MQMTDFLSLLGGLALFLYGMQMMSSGLEAAAGSRMKQILERLTANRFLGVLVGAAITAVIQSSSATTVMVVGFVNAGMMTLNQAVWIIMGANIGTTVTAVLASVGQSRDAKRLAAAHALFNLSGAAVCWLLLPQFTALVRLVSPHRPESAVLARQIANAHTLFNLGCTVLWLPLTPCMVRIVCILLPEKHAPLS